MTFTLEEASVSGRIGCDGEDGGIVAERGGNSKSASEVHGLLNRAPGSIKTSSSGALFTRPEELHEPLGQSKM